LIGRGRLLLAVMLALWLAPGAGRSGALIEFANVTEYAKPAQLFGYLARPDGSDPSPAVLILHGCQGFSSSTARLADRQKSWGYLGLAVDNLGPRGLADACGQFFIGHALDAYAALKFLSQQSFVDRNRIAVLGRSMGGSSTPARITPLTCASCSPACGFAAIGSNITSLPPQTPLTRAIDKAQAEQCRPLGSPSADQHLDTHQ
jgi:dienelactone hydrolase